MALTLNALSRGEKKSASLRAENLIPAELYGPEVENRGVALEYDDFVKIYDEAGESSLIELCLPDGKSVSILIGGVQLHPISGKYIHVDLRQVSLTEKIEANVELKFVGEAPAVKELSGIFVSAKSEIAIKALPKHLVSEIEVDISPLAQFGDKIFVRDIKLPTGAEVIDNPDAVIASISEPMKEEAPVATAEAEKAAIESVEVAGAKETAGEEESEAAK